MSISAFLEKSPWLIGPVIGTVVVWLFFAWLFPSEPLDAQDTMFVFAAWAAVAALVWSVAQKARAYFSRRHLPATGAGVAKPSTAANGGNAKRPGAAAHRRS